MLRRFFIVFILVLLPQAQALAAPAQEHNTPIHLAARANYLKTVEDPPSPPSVDSLTAQLSAATETQLLVTKDLSLTALLQQVVKQNP